MPGILGTELKKGNDLLWMNLIKMLYYSTDSFMDPLMMNQNGTAVDNTVIKGDIVRNKFYTLGTYHYFDLLINQFINSGYSESQDLFVFPYDWRLDITQSAIALQTKINEILQQTGSPKVNLVAHSMGGLVAKQYLVYGQANQVNKVLFLGTPHYGAAKALKVLLFGDSFGVPFNLLSPTEMKKLASNMFSVYQLLPGQSYFRELGSYYKDGVDYDYYQIKDLLTTLNYNKAALNVMEQLHSSGLDEVALASLGVQAYTVAGCSQPTITKIVKLNLPSLLKNLLKDNEYALQLGDGDGTVPLASARGVKVAEGNTFYVPGVSHSHLPSNELVRNLAVQLMLGNNIDTLPAGISRQDDSCSFTGKLVSVHSPVQIQVYDPAGNHFGLLDDGTFEQGIDNIWYEEIDGNKFLFLPNTASDYQIKIKATETGTFNLRISDFSSNSLVSTVYYQQVPVTQLTVGEITGLYAPAGPVLTLEDNSKTYTIAPSSVLSGEQAADLTPPTITGQVWGEASANNNWQPGAEVVITAADNLGGSGILKVEYSLDDGVVWQQYQEPLQFTKPGSYKIIYAASDRAGNWSTVGQTNLAVTNISQISDIVSSGGGIYNVYDVTSPVNNDINGVAISNPKNKETVYNLPNTSDFIEPISPLARVEGVSINRSLVGSSQSIVYGGINDTNDQDLVSVIHGDISNVNLTSEKVDDFLKTSDKSELILQGGRSWVFYLVTLIKCFFIILLGGFIYFLIKKI